MDVNHKKRKQNNKNKRFTVWITPEHDYTFETIMLHLQPLGNRHKRHRLVKYKKNKISPDRRRQRL